MRAWHMADAAEPELLYSGKVPAPQPGPGEVLVRVCAAGVTPAELQWYSTTHTRAGAPRSAAIPGHEFAGTIAALGPGVSAREFPPGMHVFGMNDWFANGATADYCISRPQWIVPMPQHLSFPEAASIPIAALCAWQGLFDRAHLQSGERVLIHGGSGGVGVFAVQLACLRGAVVLTTASGRHIDFLMQLGARQVLDYHTHRFERELSNIDVVFDAVGGEMLRRSWSVLSPTGRLVTIAASSEAQTQPRVRQSFFIVTPRADQLAQIASDLESRKLIPVVDMVVPFPQAAAAYAGTLPRPLSRGKVVVAVTP